MAARVDDPVDAHAADARSERLGLSVQSQALLLDGVYALIGMGLYVELHTDPAWDD